ncbi:MAG: site-specific integrase [Desulfobulbaceae bacterium]|nr:site-specific integrase [Desulfobulbaceae bacterium]
MAVRPHPKQLTDPRYSRTWIIDYYPQGRKGKQFKRQFIGTEGEARALEAELRRGHSLTVAPHPKIIDLLPEWLAYYANNRAASTVADAKTCLKQLVPFFGMLFVNAITPGVVEQYKAKRRLPDPATGRAAVGKRTVNKELSYLSSLITWATDNSHAAPLPFRIRPFPRVRSPKPRPLNRDQVTALINAIEPEYRLLVMMMTDGGLRRNEATMATAENVDLELGVIFVKGKGGHERLVPILTDRLRAALAHRIKETGGRGYLSVNPATGKPYYGIRKALLRAATSTGLDKNVYHHLLRHSFGTSMAAAGVDLAAIQDIMGHRDPKVTRIYAQLAAEALKAASHKAGSYMENSTPPKNTATTG